MKMSFELAHSMSKSTSIFSLVSAGLGDVLCNSLSLNTLN